MGMLPKSIYKVTPINKMSQSQLSAREKRSKSSYMALAQASFLAATVQALAIGLSSALVLNGQFKAFEPVRVLAFIPTHQTLWQSNCLVLSLCSITFLFYSLAYVMLLERKLMLWSVFAVALLLIATGTALNSQVSLLVMFSDLAQELFTYKTQLDGGMLHVAWAVLTQFFCQSILIANTLTAISGMTLSLCSFLSDSIPRPIAWSGLVLWVTTIFATVFASVGKLDFALIAWFAARILLLIYLAGVGIIIERTISKRFDVPKAKSPI